MAQRVYALDAATIDLCLSVFPWAPFRSTKAVVKRHTLLDLHARNGQKVDTLPAVILGEVMAGVAPIFE